MGQKGMDCNKWQRVLGVRFCQFFQGEWEVRGWPLLAVMKERVPYWQLSPLWARQRRIWQRKSQHERGTVRVKKKPANHLKRVWGWHIHVLHFSSICKYSTYLLCLFDVILFEIKGRQREKYLWSHIQRLIDAGGEIHFFKSNMLCHFRLPFLKLFAIWCLCMLLFCWLFLSLYIFLFQPRLRSSPARSVVISRLEFIMESSLVKDARWDFSSHGVELCTWQS